MSVAITGDGDLVPATLELHESSGPTSPRYQYHTDLRIVVDRLAATLSYRERRGAPSHQVEFQREIPRARYEELWCDLVAQDVLHRNADLVGAERRGRVGVSFNYVELWLAGHDRVRFDYLLSQLDEPQLAPYANIVKLLKGLAEQMIDPTPNPPPLKGEESL